MTDQPDAAPGDRSVPPLPAMRTPAGDRAQGPVPAATPAGSAAPVAPAGSGPGWGTGSGVAPVPTGPRSTSGRSALAVLAIIVGVVFGANLVNAAIPVPSDPGSVDPGPGIPARPQPQPAPPGLPQPDETNTPVQTPPLESQAPVEPGPVQAGTGVEVGARYLLFPPDGWTVVGGEDGLTVFQKNGVLLIAGGFPWADTAAALAVVYRDGWFTAGQFTGDEPRAGSIGNGIPAATLDYTGVVNAAQVDGAIVTGSIDGSGLILNIFGSSGTLGGIGSEFDAILQAIQHTGG